MKNFTLRIIFLLPIIVLFTPFIVYSADVTSVDSPSITENECVISAREGLKKNYPDLSEADIKYLSAYGCFCGYKNANSQKDLENCTYYSILRNALTYEIESPTKLSSDKVVEYGCESGYTYDRNDEDMHNKVVKFCQCAAKPLGEIKDQREEDLTEDQIYEKIIPIVNDCKKNLM